MPPPPPNLTSVQFEALSFWSTGRTEPDYCRTNISSCREDLAFNEENRCSSSVSDDVVMCTCTKSIGYCKWLARTAGLLLGNPLCVLRPLELLRILESSTR